nr:hypothetical protein BaRGS_017000 [Batillaria attramentaria]
MPCLTPTIFVVFLGLLVLAGGAGMCVLGYIPDKVTTLSEDGNTTTVTMVPRDARYYATKSLSYTGPILMGCGFFAIIVSCVLYCEIVDRYAVLMPKKPDKTVKRQDLMEMILGDFKKSYFRGIEVPLRKEEPPTQKREREKETLLKALSISTPVLLMSPDLAPTWRFSHYPYRYPGHRHFALKPRHPKLKQLGQSGSSGHEPWLKTSSLPNICDPELRKHNLPRPVPLDQNEVGKARRLKRLLKARCKSEDVRDKKKPDIMLLKDLFRSFDVHDNAAQPPQPHLLTVSQPAFASGSDPGLTYLDPLAGQRSVQAYREDGHDGVAFAQDFPELLSRYVNSSHDFSILGDFNFHYDDSADRQFDVKATVAAVDVSQPPTLDLAHLVDAYNDGLRQVLDRHAPSVTRLDLLT